MVPSTWWLPHMLHLIHPFTVNSPNGESESSDMKQYSTYSKSKSNLRYRQTDIIAICKKKKKKKSPDNLEKISHPESKEAKKPSSQDVTALSGSNDP